MYNREAALEYAKEWAFSRNPQFYDFENIGGDCTNFASQVLLAGGASVAEVADRVGYDTDYSFRRAFQRYTGVKAQDFTAADAQSGEGDAEKVE